MGNSSGEILKNTKKSVLDKLSLAEIFLISKQHGFSCAVYRLPRKNSKHLIIDLSSGRDLTNLHLDEMGKGFIFHPFSSDHHQIKFINLDIHIAENLGSNKLELVHSTISHDDLNDLFNREEHISNEKIATNGEIKIDFN